ncbi:MAG: LysR family transcriptional regulator [Clostridia bacterium]|nr:LysR family transcriptional regulator [Clostridia bacterium]MBR0205403.1 LysR family transcriptional regulator [Clostridia bacterium]
MNLLHLKYAVEIAETNSMTKAAERLYTAQPNLSRAVKELESTLGIPIFRRTSKGIFPTPQGEEFLSYARIILSQVDEIERMYQQAGREPRRFSVCGPHACYIACAFTSFVQHLESPASQEIFYNETSPSRVINNVADADYRLGILRYPTAHDASFKELLKERGLSCELLYEFNYVLLTSSKSPLAVKSAVQLSDLAPLTEIAHADPFAPTLPLSMGQKKNPDDRVNKHIYVFERGSQMDLLSLNPNTFLWASPVPQRMLDQFDLIQRVCPENDRTYRDMLIYKKGYALTSLDKAFIDELVAVKRELGGAE